MYQLGITTCFRSTSAQSLFPSFRPGTAELYLVPPFIISAGPKAHLWIKTVAKAENALLGTY
jgi:hypothetical protein